MSMSWGSIFRKSDVPSTETYSFPAVTPLQQQRLKQIESLSLYNKNVIEEERDKDYSIKFAAATKTFFLRITLPSQFPNEKPIVRLSPEAKHPWLNEKMYITGCGALNCMYITGCGALNCFYMHSNLGKVIKQIIDELRANISSFDLPAMSINSDEDAAASNTYDEDHIEGFLKSKSTESNTPTAMLICTDSHDCEEETDIKQVLSGCKSIEEFIAAMKKMSMGDIEKLSANSDELVLYIQNMDIVTDLQKQRHALLESNLEQAEQNLAYKPKIENLKSDLDATMRKIEILESEFSSKSVKQDELFQIFNLNQIITNLKIAVSQAEESSEEIADQFLEDVYPIVDRNAPITKGDFEWHCVARNSFSKVETSNSSGRMTIDDFLKQFLDQRQLMHLRKSKEERIRYLNPEY